MLLHSLSLKRQERRQLDPRTSDLPVNDSSQISPVPFVLKRIAPRLGPWSTEDPLVSYSAVNRWYTSKALRST
jgi:hypothetical protein